MRLSGFAIEVLGMLGNDYETPQAIASDLSRELERTVKESEVRAALLSLAGEGWAQAFVFEPAAGRYTAVEAAEAEEEKALWFVATSEGMAAYEDSAG